MGKKGREQRRELCDDGGFVTDIPNPAHTKCARSDCVSEPPAGEPDYRVTHRHIGASVMGQAISRARLK